MVKKILTLVTLVLLTAYLVVSAVAFSSAPKDGVCKGVELQMSDGVEAGFMTVAEVVTLLKKNNIDPTGKPLDEVSLKVIEEGLERSPLIRNSESYKTMDGHVVVRVECRRPILRVMTTGGESYYLDEEGKMIDHIAKALYLPLATGYITREYAQKNLLPLAHYLWKNELWNAQITQICVMPNGDIELIPRVGDHTIVLGRPDNYAEKFDKLKAFYEKGLGELGWDRYERINIDYDGQVVATKRQ